MLPFYKEIETSHEEAIEVHLDQSDFQRSHLVQNELILTFRIFMQRLMRDCESSEKLFNPPIVFEALFGKFDFDFKKHFALGFILK